MQISFIVLPNFPQQFVCVKFEVFHAKIINVWYFTVIMDETNVTGTYYLSNPVHHGLQRDIRWTRCGVNDIAKARNKRHLNPASVA